MATFRDSANVQVGGNGSGVTPVIPATIQPGDLGILVAIAGGGSGAPNAPTGWDTLVASTLTGTGGGRFSIYTRAYQAGDANPTVVYPSAPGSGNNICALVGWWSNAASPVAGSVNVSTTSTAAWSCPSLTTSGDGRTVVSVSGEKGSGSGFPSSVTMAPDATVRATRYGTSTFYPGAVLADMTQATAGATNAQTATWNFATNNGFGVQIELAPNAVNVALTGAVTGSTTGAPAGTVSAASTTTNVALTGGVVASTTGAMVGSLTLTTTIDDTGAVVGSTTAAPAGTLSVTSVVNVALTGGVVGSASAAPAGTVSASSGATNVTLTGAVAGSTTAALAGALTISSVGNVSLVGQPVGSGSGAPDGTLTLVSVGNVNLTGPPVGSVTTAPAGTRTTVTNVTLGGLVTASTSQALAGLLEVVSSSSVNLIGGTAGSTTDALNGSLTITSAGDATANPAAHLTLDPTPSPSLTATPTLTLTMTRPEVTLDNTRVTVGDTAPLTGKAGSDLTGATVEAHVQLKDGTVTILTTTVTDAATGAWSAEWPTGGVPDVPGVASVELAVTYSDTTDQTLGPVMFSIRSQYA